MEKYLHINGMRMFYRVYGDGSPIILIHGGAATGDLDWHGLIPLLSDNYTVYVPDSRGHGKSDNPDGIFSYSLMADDYLALINAENIENPTIIGHSDGAQIAMEMALKYSKLKMIILNGVMNGEVEETRKSMAVAGLYEDRVDIEKVKKVFGSYYTLLHTEFSHVYGDDYLEEYLQKIAKLWLDEGSYLHEKIGEITVKTVVIQGDRDTLTTPEAAMKIYRSIPDAELCVMPNSDHTVAARDPQKFYHYLKYHLG
ncbi:MAG: alpha/beta hydrolase [Candidatus Heimdallarchaeota archaeon]|nr:alpha/beta hydrolase [Candidatus Heimdallarchaeota archaeon]